MGENHYVANIFDLKASCNKSSFTSCLAIETFISGNPSWGNFGLTMFRYLDVPFIFNPALDFLFSCLFHFIINWRNHHIILIQRSVLIFYFVQPYLFVTLLPHAQNPGKTTFLKCLSLPVVLLALLITYSFLHSKSISLPSLHLMVCPGFGLSVDIVVWNILIFTHIDIIRNLYFWRFIWIFQ